MCSGQMFFPPHTSSRSDRRDECDEGREEFSAPRAVAMKARGAMAMENKALLP